MCLTPRLFGGLLLDVQRKAPHYLSDYGDAFSLQCLASLLFLYCACMSPVITFGGLLGEATEGRIVRLLPLHYPAPRRHRLRHHHGYHSPSLHTHTLRYTTYTAMYKLKTRWKHFLLQFST